MDNLQVLVFGVIGYLVGVLTLATALYWLKSREVLEQLAENIINDLATDENYQKQLFNIGAIIAAGAKQGFGVQMPGGNRGGKFKLNDFLLEMAAQWFTKGVVSPTAQVAAGAVKDKFFNT